MDKNISTHKIMYILLVYIQSDKQFLLKMVQNTLENEKEMYSNHSLIISIWTHCTLITTTQSVLLLKMTNNYC